MRVQKVLVVGLGSIGRRHVQVIKKLYPEVVIAALRHDRCDDKETSSAGLDHCFTKLEDALQFQPNAAVIANPASMHLNIAMELATVGIHLLVEKPIAVSVDGVQRLIDLCSAKNIVLMTAYNLRFLPALNVLRDLLLQGKLGQLHSVRAEVGQYLPTWRPDVDYRQTVSAKKNMGGGVLLELSHEIDYLSWLFGSVEWVGGYVSQQGDLQIDVEDTAHLIMCFKSNGSGKGLIASLNMDFIRHDTTRKCVVTGDKGTLCWDGIAGKIEFYSAKEKAWQKLYSDQPDRNFTYEKEMGHFFSCIEACRSPQVSGEDGMNALAVIDAIRKSSNTGKRIYLEEMSS